MTVTGSRDIDTRCVQLLKELFGYFETGSSGEHRAREVIVTGGGSGGAAGSFRDELERAIRSTSWAELADDFGILQGAFSAYIRSEKHVATLWLDRTERNECDTLDAHFKTQSASEWSWISSWSERVQKTSIASAAIVRYKSDGEMSFEMLVATQLIRACDTTSYKALFPDLDVGGAGVTKEILRRMGLICGGDLTRRAAAAKEWARECWSPQTTLQSQPDISASASPSVERGSPNSTLPAVDAFLFSFGHIEEEQALIRAADSLYYTFVAMYGGDPTHLDDLGRKLGYNYVGHIALRVHDVLAERDRMRALIVIPCTPGGLKRRAGADESPHHVAYFFGTVDELRFQAFRRSPAPVLMCFTIGNLLWQSTLLTSLSTQLTESIDSALRQQQAHAVGQNVDSVMGIIQRIEEFANPGAQPLLDDLKDRLTTTSRQMRSLLALETRDAPVRVVPKYEQDNSFYLTNIISRTVDRGMDVLFQRGLQFGSGRYKSGVDHFWGRHKAAIRERWDIERDRWRANGRRYYELPTLLASLKEAPGAQPPGFGLDISLPSIDEIGMLAIAGDIHAPAAADALELWLQELVLNALKHTRRLTDDQTASIRVIATAPPGEGTDGQGTIERLLVENTCVATSEWREGAYGLPFLAHVAKKIFPEHQFHHGLTGDVWRAGIW